MKRKSSQHDESVRDLAIDVLAWLAAAEDRLFPFLGATGLSPQDVRASLADPAFLAGVLDYVTSDEGVLIACARALSVEPERIADAWRQTAAPPEPDEG